MTEVKISLSTKHPKSWAIKFWFKTGDSEYDFLAGEPHLVSKEDWLKLAGGKRSIVLYTGSGEGGIYQEADKLTFITIPFGGIGCVFSRFSISRCLVADKLKAVIEESSELGLKFAD